MPTSVSPCSARSSAAPPASSSRAAARIAAVSAVACGERVRAGGPGEVVEAQPQHDGAPHPVRRAQPARHPVDDRRPATASTSPGARRRAAEGVLRPDRPAAPADLHRPGSRLWARAWRWRPAAGPSIATSAASASARDVAHGEMPRAWSFSAVTGPTPHSRSTGSGCRNVELAVRRHDEQPVGLGHRARHLGEELGAGDADGDRQADPSRTSRRSRDGDLAGRARRPAAARRRRGTPRRSRGPRPAASCRRRPRTPPCWPRCTPPSAAATTTASGTAAGPARRPSPCARRTPWPRSWRRAPRRRRRSPAGRAGAGRRAARPTRRTSRGRRGGSSPRRARTHVRTRVRARSLGLRELRLASRTRSSSSPSCARCRSECDDPRSEKLPAAPTPVTSRRPSPISRALRRAPRRRRAVRLAGSRRRPLGLRYRPGRDPRRGRVPRESAPHGRRPVAPHAGVGARRLGHSDLAGSMGRVAAAARASGKWPPPGSWPTTASARTKHGGVVSAVGRT